MYPEGGGYKLKKRMEAYVSLSYTYVFLLDFPGITVIRSKESILQCVDAELKVKGRKPRFVESPVSSTVSHTKVKHLAEDHPA